MALGSVAIASGQTDRDGWELRRDRDGIRVYVREVPGTPFMAYRAETTIEARLQTLVAILTEIDAAAEWIHYTEAGELVRQIDARTAIVSLLTDLPWPASDRDSVTENRVSQDPATGVVEYTFVSIAGELPTRDDYVRVEQLNGFWVLTPTDSGTVDVVYSVQSDPGGSIPAWLVNLGIVEQPYQTLENLQRMVDDPRFRDATVDFIREP